MNTAICEPLAMLNIRPVLVDIGAAGARPEIWRPIAARSIYVGFDPDHREIQVTSNREFHQATIVEGAVAEEDTNSEVLFYLTKSPYCSSRLKPDFTSLSSYLFSKLFEVEREALVRTESLNSALERLHLPVVDWIKLDTQGTDLRLFNSLREDIRSRVLAVDVEPGLIDAYQGEDLFVDTHQRLIQSGFWLSKLEVHGATRMRRSTLDELTAVTRGLTERMITEASANSPAWCEARYFRTLESLTLRGAGKRDYVLLWAFALLDRQLGVALDLALDYQRTFGSDPVSKILKDEPLRRMRQFQSRNWLPKLKKATPVRLRQMIKKRIG
jgi:hypothetical protein